MTSPLRRKHQTTPPSIPATHNQGQRTSGEGGQPLLDVLVDASTPLPPSTFRLRREPLWLPAGLLAALLTLTMALTAVGGEHRSGGESLGWRAAGVGQSHVSQRHVTRRPAPTKLHKRTVRRDRLVRPIGYDDDLYAAPSSNASDSIQAQYSGAYSGQRQGSARMRSIIVRNSNGGSSYRVAQNDDEDFGAELKRQLEEPFGVEELPAQQDEGFDPFEPGESDEMTDDNGFDIPDFGDDADDNNQTLPPVDDDTPNPLDPPRMRDDDQPDENGNEFDPDEFDTSEFDTDDFNDDDLRRPDRDQSEAERLRKQRSQSMKDCSEELAELRSSRLATIDIHIGLPGQEGKDYPFVCSINTGEPFAPRCWEQVTYMWKASALCHKPLYFEQKHLERYGHSWGPYVDPLVSGAHFFTRFPVLPYCMGLKAPNECVYALGHYRPGSCAPYMIEPIPFTPRAALFEMGAWTGGAFLVP